MVVSYGPRLWKHCMKDSGVCMFSWSLQGMSSGSQDTQRAPCLLHTDGLANSYVLFSDQVKDSPTQI